MQTVSRLLDQFIPHHYDLSINLDRNERSFSGIVTINGSSPNGTLALHAKDLSIESITVNGHASAWTQQKNDELLIESKDFTAGKVIIVVAFSGVISDAMHGLYPCYFEVNGVKKQLLATQFESHHAREVFPCIDEPAAKATFDVTLTTELAVQVLGNMPIKSQTQENERLVTTFQTTPRMSSYLLAWVVGELHKKSAVTKRGVEVNVWATAAHSASMFDFPLDIAVRTIDFFEEYFGIDYPLPKSDHVALPDFSSGAMENWGLITYREMALLADTKHTSVSSRHYVATVIAHELSHQWFGNLVTMNWWNNLWLNESFATVMEYIAIDALHPEWNAWLDFATQESIMALRRDAISGVQPVQVEVNHPDEISTIFDGAIVYAKGARLLRMLESYLGQADFRKGLADYFKTHAYGNTEADDLWRALQNASGKDVSGLMSAWISQPGYPVVTMQCANEQTTLTQEQFFIWPAQKNSKLWPIPLHASDSAFPERFDTHELIVEGTQPARLNVGDSAHFLTHYDEVLFDHHLLHLYDAENTVLDRLQLLHEQTLLARGNRLPSDKLIPLLTAYRRETTEPVWDIMSLALSELKKFVDPDTLPDRKLRDLAIYLAKDNYNRLGWTAQANESEEDTKLRSIVVSMMLYGEDPEAIATALNLSSSKPVEQLDPNLRALILGAGVRHGDGSNLIDTLITTYRTTSSNELMMDISSALASSRDQGVLKKIVALTSDESTVRPQDAVRWFIGVMRNRDGRSIAWQWLQENWDWVMQTFGGDKSYDDFPRYAASILMTQEEYEEYEAFFGPMQDEPSLKRTIAMGLSDIKARVELIERDANDVRQRLIELEI